MSPKPWTNEPIAIVGTACHFAGDTNSPSKLWELLRDPRDVRSEIPSSRFSAEGFYHPNNAHHGHSNVKHSYFIDDDLSAFDAEFFGINPVEGKAMDPQQRLLIETVYEATEAAGMTINELRGSDTGVYVGVMCGDYEAMLQRDLDASPTYFAVGTARSILSNRISYFFNWHGPSITMDTACSSSLVAVHTAVQALRSGESRMAVACGSNLILGPESYIIESKLKMLSPDGRSRMWDRDANGYARGDGVAAVMLKTLSAALADGDHIECLIKETGVNQDGATGGITMPSAAAQQDLIRKTYVKAGLDCRVLEDRPQYFEAHGTGTPAGDPVEAEAISRSFFCDEKDATLESGDNNPLYVGSIKTVLGHTEGTAGVAAILKASLAIQHSCIPPNLLFENLSPSVAPFYDNLEICRTAKPWPKISDTQPRRASVNSFGFGGTNAHAILESYDPPTGPLLAAPEALNPLFTPFVFSATSEKHLRANLSAYAAYLKDFPVLDVQDLAYTLRQRRSIFPYRATFTATSVDGLRSKILERLENEDTKVGVKGLESNSGVTPRVLGVFSGQGTQYARMGGELIEKSPLARQIIQNLESELARLPGADRPRWSLQAEILADASSSRVSEAAISQPLCTAVQIMLVDLLKLANIKFDAVIGHSSGEIAAAYAAGYLTARDAIYIAYYRGLRCQYAASPNGNIKGAMIAVGTSLEDATELCELDEFAGRINVAASNSPSSVTISGDEDAIEELQIILDDEKKFNRRLRVDQAYHSRHMLPCFEPYVESMQRAGVNALEGISSSSPQCTWFSSVYDGQIVDLDLGLSDVYWAENMTKPVLFSQALTAALSAGSAFDVALEVGSHPALKGPADQTIQDVLQKQLPYHGTLSRGSDAIGAASQCLGFLWSHLGKVSIDLNGYELAVSGTQQQCLKVVKNLPAYQWNHESKYWHESRRSRQMRLRKSPFHPLLGDISPDSAPHHLRWKNILKSSEIDWIEGHQVQSQSVFPAAGYVSTAVEAAQVLARDEDVRLIELSDFVIHQAVMFEADDPGIEVQIELSQISRVQPNRIQATFTYSAALGAQATDFSLAAGGQLSIILGETSLSLLPERGPSPPHLIDVEPSRLYNFMESLGYNFTGRFRSLSQLSRKLGKASCQAASVPTDQRESLLVHPAELDASFQSVMLAYSYPGDDQLRTMHLPTRVDKIRINPALCGSRWAQTEYLTVDSVCNPIDREAAGSGFSGHVNLYSNDSRNAAIQADGVAFVPLGTSSNDDRNVFYKMHWVPSAPDGITAAKDIPVTHHDTELLWVLSRIASYYLRKFDEEVPLDAVARSEPPLCHYLNYAQHMTSLLKSGKHKYAKNEWVNDTLDDVMAEVKEKEYVSHSNFPP